MEVVQTGNAYTSVVINASQLATRKGFQETYSDQDIFPKVAVTWEAMRQEGRLCDVFLKTDDNHKPYIPAHRLVLEAVSPVFTDLCTQAKSDGRREETIVVLKGLDINALECVVKYMYLGALSITEDKVENLILAADALGLSRVVNRCVELMIKHLNFDNVLQFLVFARTEKFRKLYMAAQDLIQCQIKNIDKLNKFYEIMEYCEIRKIVENQNRSAEDEQCLFDMVLKWINIHPERLQFTTMLVRKIRLALLPKSMLRNRFQEEAILKNMECRQLYIIVMEHYIMKSRNLSDLRLKFESVQHRDCWISEWKGAPTHSLGNGFSAITGNSSMPSGSRLAYLCGFGNKQSVHAYDFATKTTSIVAHRARRRQDSSLVVTKDLLLDIGGLSTSRASREVFVLHRKSSDILSYSSWVAGPHLNIGRSDFASVVVKNTIYLIGGYNGKDSLSSLESTRIDEGGRSPWRTTTELPDSQYGRCSCAAGILKDLIIIAGGTMKINTKTQVLSSVFAYNPESLQWTEIADMEERRHGVRVVNLNGDMYAVGGSNDKEILQSVEVYNVERNEWKPIPRMNVPRINSGVAAFNGRIYAFGGDYGRSEYQTVETYDPREGKWIVEPFMKTEEYPNFSSIGLLT